MDASLADQSCLTPLLSAAFRKNVDMMEWLIASGKNLGDLKKGARYGGQEVTAIEIARDRSEIFAGKI